MSVFVTTDGSARSLHALPHADRLARALGRDLMLFRALNPRIDAASELNTSLSAAVEAVSARWEAELAESLAAAGVPGKAVVRPMARDEDVHEAILRVGHEMRAELFAIDTRGAGAVRHALLGSVAMGVIRDADRPVMTTGHLIAPPIPRAGYRVIATSDGSTASEDVMRAVGPLLEERDAAVTLLTVYEPRGTAGAEAAEAARLRTALEGMAGLFPSGIAVTPMVSTAHRGESVAACIIRIAGELGADAIACSTHGHSAVRHLLAGSTALGLLEKSPFPVILGRGRS